MKQILLVALLAGNLGADAIISSFANVRSVTIGNSHCTLWMNSPKKGQVQMACYNGATISLNVIKPITNNSWLDIYEDENGMVIWLIKPSKVSGFTFDYQIAGFVSDQATETKLLGSY